MLTQMSRLFLALGFSHVGQNDRQRRWRHAFNPRRLSNRAGTDQFQFRPHFIRQARDSVVIEFRIKQNAFIPLQNRRRNGLAIKVDGIFCVDFDLRCNPSVPRPSSGQRLRAGRSQYSEKTGRKGGTSDAVPIDRYPGAQAFVRTDAPLLQLAPQRHQQFFLPPKDVGPVLANTADFIPLDVRRKSALSHRSDKRNSAREVNIR